MRDDGLAEFEAHRRYLFGLAYRMTGSVADAEDLVQEAWVRWARVDQAQVRSPRAFLSRIVSRLGLDQLKSARARREEYVGPWLPEPLLGEDASADAAVELAQDVSMAMMLALERLSPLERAVFLLKDVFDREYSEIAETLGRSEPACRKLASRARTHVHAQAPRRQATPAEHDRVLGAFVSAVMSGDMDTLSAVLAEDVVFYSDGGGRVLAARKPIHSARKVALFLLGVARKFPLSKDAAVEFAAVNGRPGIVIREGAVVTQTQSFDIEGERIRAIYVVRNPEKLAHLRVLEG